MQVADAVVFLDHIAVVKAHRRCRQGLIVVGVVAKDQLAAGFLVFEKVVDAILLHQACQKIRAGFLELCAVLQCLVRIVKPGFVIVEGELGEHLIDDVRNTQLLEVPCVLVVQQKPERRHQLAAVMGETLRLPTASKTGDFA
ncbi:hypothetical protein D3C85_1505880 [compost metagenome]